jgi:hypothetical protein
MEEEFPRRGAKYDYYYRDRQKFEGVAGANIEARYQFLALLRFFSASYSE